MTRLLGRVMTREKPFFSLICRRIKIKITENTKLETWDGKQDTEQAKSDRLSVPRLEYPKTKGTETTHPYFRGLDRG